jgi:hypothetical protein
MQKLVREKGPQSKYYLRRIFHRKKKTAPVRDVEQQGSPITGDDIMRHQILEEIESIRRSVDQQVDAELGLDKENTKEFQREIASLDKGKSRLTRRKWTRESDGDVEDDGDADDEGIDEEDVAEAVREVREGPDWSSSP